MASYRNIYQFGIFSQNGDDVDIFISKKNYSGPVQRRALGRAPVLKRERNGNILGTSLEIFAECKADGEFAQLYTSSADEFLVEVYRNQTLLWLGYVSPELYAEPDIAPPYDVQIIATDGLGELKEVNFSREGRASLQTHLTDMLSHTGLSVSMNLISSLQWDDQQVGHSPDTLLAETGVDLSYRIGDTCYDVLQDLLASLNACITLQGGQWMIIRESDIYNNIGRLAPLPFGSMNSTEWWPVGSLSTDIIPAKKRITLTQENEYKENILTPIYTGVAGGWGLTSGVYYDGVEDGYIIPNSGESLSYTVNFRDIPLQSPLRLIVRARCITSEDGEEDSKLALTILMNGEINSSTRTSFHLLPNFTEGASREDMQWHSGDAAGFTRSWEPPRAPEGEPPTHDVEVVIPLYQNNAGRYALADQLTIKISNAPQSPYRLCVYDVVLAADQQSPGMEIVADIANNAREVMSDVDVILTTNSDASLSEVMYGQLMGDGSIVKLYTPASTAPDLLRFLARDYAMLVALPRLRYRGKLNVPSMSSPRIPLLFSRDNTYYFLNSYTLDLLNDEMEVELISIANASVAISKETISELASKSSPSVQGGGSSAGGSSTTVITPSLEGLTDTVISSPKNGHILIYENGKWINKDSAGGAGGSAALETDIVAGVAVGYISKSATLSVGMTFTEFVQMMFSQGVKTVPPLVSLSGVPSQAIEVGTEVKLNITSSFKDGYFANTDEVTTAAGCKPGTASFALNGLPVTMPHTFVASSAAVNVVSVSQPYEASTVKPTKGGAELSDTIPAGTASAESTFVVGYRAFWGYMTDEEAESLTSDSVRKLEYNNIINPTQDNVTLLNEEHEVPGGKDLVIAVPDGYKLSEVIDKTTSTNFGNKFDEHKIEDFQCAGEAKKGYKVYRYDNYDESPMYIKRITINKEA